MISALLMKLSWKKNEKFYEILVVEQGSQELSAKELRFGPYLMREQAPAFVQKWSKEVEKLAFALEQVPVENQSARASLEEPHRSNQGGSTC